MSNNLPVPITREERYLAYIAGRKDVEIPKKPITRKEKYLDRWAFNRDIKVVEVTGNPVQCTPIPGFNMKVTASWKPKQEGEGEPYPAGGGKNVLDPSIFPPRMISNGITWTISSDGTVTADGTSPGNGYFNFNSFDLVAGTYTIGAMPNYRMTIRDDDETPIAASVVGRSKTFTLNKDTKVSGFLACSGTHDKTTGKPCLLKGAADTGFAPYENIRPITGRDSVMVKRCGENLLNITKFNKVTEKGIDFEYLADGGIHIVGTATAAVDSPIFTIPFLPSGKYYGLDLGVDIFASIVVIRNGNKSWLNTKGVFKILTGDITQYWYIFIEKGSTVDRILYPYIVAGTVAPTDEKNPYEMQANTLTLTETIYGGSVDAATGEGEKQYGFYTLTGREPHHIYGGMFYLDVPKAKANGQRESGICSHYNYGVYIPGKIGVTDRPVYTPNGDYTPDNDGAIAWKAYLAAQYAAGTPVQIAYKLAEPVPFKATGGQPIKALKGINTVFTDADSVSVKYKKMREV